MISIGLVVQARNNPQENTQRNNSFTPPLDTCANIILKNRNVEFLV